MWYWLRNKVRSCWHSGGNATDRCVKANDTQIFIQKRFEVIFQPLDEEQAHGATK